MSKGSKQLQTPRGQRDLSGAVTAKWIKGCGPAGDECYNLVAATIRTKEGRGCERGDGTDNLVAHTLRGEGFDASEDGTGRGTPIVTQPIPILEVGGGTTSRGVGPNGCGIGEEGDVMFTLQQAHQHGVAFAQNQRNELRELDVASSQSSIRRGDAKNETLIAFSAKDHGADAGELAPTLRAGIHDKSHENGGCPPAVAFTERTRADGRNFESQEEVSYALTNPGSGGRTHSRQIAANSMVRRLTPTECERLQGFPDGWTAGFSDSTRYRMLGNAVAVPCAEWIARRLKLIYEHQ